ncbi:MAG: hypothetical protein IIA82_04535 [Thaumarchaeota archaeon]|nr:hypothetical protein [Nitrososphaerota archaeon]
MKRFSRKSFSQIMINNSLKNELDQLKQIVANEISATWNLSYGDVIFYLIKKFKQQTFEYEIEPKLLVANQISESNLKISTPLNNNRIFSSRKLDKKIRVSYTLE